MAYDCPNGGCPRLNYFSNPAVLVGSAAAGVANDRNNSANCAATLNYTAPFVAKFRAAVAAAVCPVGQKRCPGGTACIPLGSCCAGGCC
jgi:hypothetical protein